MATQRLSELKRVSVKASLPFSSNEEAIAGLVDNVVMTPVSTKAVVDASEGGATFNKKEFTASEGQTSFNIESDFDATKVMVFLNSALIRNWSKSGNNLVISSAITGDVVDVILF